MVILHHTAVDIGDWCSFSCDEMYRATIKPTTFVCTTGGVWDRDAHELCVGKFVLLYIPLYLCERGCRSFGWCYAHFRDKMSFRDTIWAVVFYMSRTRRRNMCFKLWRWTMESVHVVCSSTGFWDNHIGTISTARSQFSKYYLHTDIITFSTISIDVSVSCVV